MYVRVRKHTSVCVSLCMGAHESPSFNRRSLYTSSSPPPFALALPSQPSTSPRLVSNDFPPSYPDSGTHPWGTASPFLSSEHRRLPSIGATLIPASWRFHVKRNRTEIRWEENSHVEINLSRFPVVHNMFLKFIPKVLHPLFDACLPFVHKV